MPTSRGNNFDFRKGSNVVWVLFCFAFFGANAQMIDYVPFSKAVNKESRWIAFGDTRNSFLENSTLKIRGIKIGKEWDETWQIGGGLDLANVEDVRPNASSRLVGFGAFLAYGFKWKGYQYKIPLQLNYGTWKEVRSHSMISYEAALVITKRYFDFLILGAGVGYRLLLYSNVPQISGGTAPVYLLKVGIDPKTLGKKLGVLK